MRVIDASSRTLESAQVSRSLPAPTAPTESTLDAKPAANPVYDVHYSTSLPTEPRMIAGVNCQIAVFVAPLSRRPWDVRDIAVIQTDFTADLQGLPVLVYAGHDIEPGAFRDVFAQRNNEAGSPGVAKQYSPGDLHLRAPNNLTVVIVGAESAKLMVNIDAFVAQGEAG